MQGRGENSPFAARTASQTGGALPVKAFLQFAGNLGDRLWPPPGILPRDKPPPILPMQLESARLQSQILFVAL